MTYSQAFYALSNFNSFSKGEFSALPNRKSLQIAISNLKENCRKFLNRVENTVGKEKLLVTSNVSISRCFQKTCTADT